MERAGRCCLAMLAQNQTSVPNRDPTPCTMRAGPAIIHGRQKGFMANIIPLAEIHQVSGSPMGMESSKHPSELTGTDSGTAGAVGP